MEEDERERSVEGVLKRECDLLKICVEMHVNNYSRIKIHIILFKN